MKNFPPVLFIVLVTALLFGCSSGRVNITAEPKENYEKLGRVEGSACGMLGLLATAYYFVPMGINGRYESAYEEALSKMPGARGLIDVTIREDWYWWVIGTARCVKITGEAIK